MLLLALAPPWLPRRGRAVGWLGEGLGTGAAQAAFALTFCRNEFFFLLTMKKIMTLLLTGWLGLLSLGARAQVTLDGMLGAGEVGAAKAGKYSSLGQYPYAHGFEEGLLAFYGANSATKLYLLVAGTLQPYPKGNNSFQVFVVGNRPGGVYSNVPLPSPHTLGSSGSTTSFGQFKGTLDQAVNFGLALHTNGTPGQYQVEAAVYHSVNYPTGPYYVNGPYLALDTVLTATAAPLLDDGTVLTLPAIASGYFKLFSKARMAYRTTADGLLTSNPGYVTPVTTAGTTPGTTYGMAPGTTGWEIELDRAALSQILSGSNQGLNLFVQQNNNDGSYVSSDYIPHAVFNAGANLGSNPNYNDIEGNQFAFFDFATVTLAARAPAAEALALDAFPNPASDLVTVSYEVATPMAAVSVTLVDLLGRVVRTLDVGGKGVGTQFAVLRTSGLPSGTYFVRVQMDGDVATRPLVLR